VIKRTSHHRRKKSLLELRGKTKSVRGGESRYLGKKKEKTGEGVVDSNGKTTKQ